MKEIVEVTTTMRREDAEYLKKAIKRSNGNLHIYTRWERWTALGAAFLAGFLFAFVVVMVIILKGN